MATHILPLSPNVSYTFTLQSEHVCQVWFKNAFSPQLLAYVVTMATHFPPFLKKFLAHLHLKANMQTQFLLNCLWNVLFFSFWNMLLPWQRTSRHCPKMCHAQLHFNVNMYAKFYLKCISPSILGIICCYHGNTLSSTVKKCVLHYTIRPPCVPNFTLNA